MPNPDWIGVDWGTTNLRAWGMCRTGGVLAEATSNQGMAKLGPEAYEPVLLDLVGNWLPEIGRIPVVVCGMAGAKGAWQMSPYREAPCPPLLASQSVQPLTVDERLQVSILPGIRQSRPDVDVMRGEETQVAGYLSMVPDFDGVICLPGTHSKWVHVSAGEIVSFRTFMTGEIYDLVKRESVLRDLVDENGGDWDPVEFQNAVETQIARPELLMARLFSIRAAALVSNLGPGRAAARLSGTLVGAELAGARPYWLGRDLILIGEKRLSNLYAAGLRRLGQTPRFQDSAAMTIAGLAEANRGFAGDPESARVTGGVGPKAA